MSINMKKTNTILLIIKREGGLGHCGRGEMASSINEETQLLGVATHVSCELSLVCPQIETLVAHYNRNKLRSDEKIESTCHDTAVAA